MRKRDIMRERERERVNAWSSLYEQRDEQLDRPNSKTCTLLILHNFFRLVKNATAY